jgi:uncharacterized protein YjbI with pentapeptide repeats
MLARSPVGKKPIWLGWVVLGSWVIAIATIAGMVLAIWLALGSPNLAWNGQLSPRSLDAIATRAFAVVAGLGGVALLVINYRRQRTTEADAQRAEETAEREVAKLFTDTFDSASDKLGSEHAAVRLAGIHALARLADEAPPEREDLVQMVIDVLCAYLRMPYTPHPGDLLPDADDALQAVHRQEVLEFESFREVRHTIIRIIGNRLREGTRWLGKDYDFTGVVFDGGDLHGAQFIGGKVDFSKAQFAGGKVDFSKAQFSGAEVRFDFALFSGSKVVFFECNFNGGSVRFAGNRITGGLVTFAKARFNNGGVSFVSLSLIGGNLSFHDSRFEEGEITFLGSQLLEGKASFNEAEFRGATVLFTVTKSIAGVATFHRTTFTSGKVNLSLAEGACPSGILEASENVSPSVLILNGRWLGP